MLRSTLKWAAMAIFGLLALGGSLLAPELLAGGGEAEVNVQLLSVGAVIALSGWLAWLRRR